MIRGNARLRTPSPEPSTPLLMRPPSPSPALALAAAFLLLTLGGAGLSAQDDAKILRAGAATSNITPELGGEVVGGFAPFPATHIHDELHARCLVLDDGETRVALVVCDLLGLHRSVSVEARQLIEARTGIPASHVLVSATHTHSAVNAIGGNPRTYEAERELTPYQDFVARRIADGVVRAVNNLRPAQFAFGTVEIPEHVFNRRWFMKEGTVAETPFGVTTDKVRMNPPGGSPDLIEPAGPVDPLLSFVALREPDGPYISVFAAYSLHYVGGVGPGHISADYFAVFCEALKRLLPGAGSGPDFVAILANGTSGDINNINFREPRERSAPYERMRAVGEDVADKVYGALGDLEWSDHITVDALYRELPVAWREIDDELLEWARRTEAEAASPLVNRDRRSLVYAARVQQLAKTGKAEPESKLPVQVLRLGDVCIGTTPVETFAETGLEFRERSPFAKSFVVELAHGYYGYMPPPRHFELGGYETWPGTNNLEPEAEPMVMEALLEMAAELKESAP